MTDQHPITPPPDLLHQWATEYRGNPGESIGEGKKYIAIQAARWGADAELEACCGLLRQLGFDVISDLRAARRPKSPSLKELALAALKRQKVRSVPSLIATEDCDTIRKALEQLYD